jgi:hypothetical protein
MKAAKGYLGVLGTMGLLTATVVVLLLVGSGAAALEGPADAGGAASPLERIVVEEDAWWADRTPRGRADRMGAALGRGGTRGLPDGLAGGGHVLGRVPGGTGGGAGDGGAGDGHAGGGLSDSGTGSGTLDGGTGGGTVEGGSPGGRGVGGGSNGGGKPLPGPVGDTVRGALDGVVPGLGALR